MTNCRDGQSSADAVSACWERWEEHERRLATRAVLYRTTLGSLYRIRYKAADFSYRLPLVIIVDFLSTS